VQQLQGQQLATLELPWQQPWQPLLQQQVLLQLAVKGRQGVP
jgi:hypothetical protein